MAAAVALTCAAAPSARGEAPLLHTREAVEPLTGPLIDVRPARPAASPRDAACSFRRAICVHGRDARAAGVLAALDAAERAWDVVTGALALPAPDADLETRAYDVYLVAAGAAGPLGATTVLATRDARGGMDRASAFTLLDERLALVGASPSCALDYATAASVARASLFRAAPATDEGSARAETAYVARLVAPCALGDPLDVDVFQSHAERALIDPWHADGAAIGEDPIAGVRFDQGAQLFFWWLDSFYGAAPGAIIRATWALSPTVTPPSAARWNDEPDGFDVLRFSFKDALTNGSTIEDLFAEFGATRALVGSRENGAELPEARALGDAALPRFDWAIDWPAKPRRLASPAPLAPTGSSYVLVRHADAPPGARLRVEAEWEQHAAIRWTVVKLDAQMRELGRVPIAAPPRETHAQGTIANLDGVASLLLVATNVGDPFAPFDPDDEVFEPHAWLVTLAAE